MLEFTIYHTQCEHVNHYAADAVLDTPMFVLILKFYENLSICIPNLVLLYINLKQIRVLHTV